MTPSSVALTLHANLRRQAEPSDTSVKTTQQAWMALSEEAISNAAQAVEQHWSIRWESRIRRWGAALPALLGVGLALYFGPRFAHPQSWLESMTLALFGGLAGGSIADLLLTYLVLPLLQQDRKTAMRLLASAQKEPFLCESAVQMVEAYAAPKAYRDAVVSANRALRVLDVEMILHLGYHSRAATIEEEHRKMCQRLHGLTGQEA